MELSQYALIISLMSLLIAGISLGWSIHRDVLRPRVKISFGVNLIISEEGPENESYLIISGTNMGPGEVRLVGIHLRPQWGRLKRFFKMTVPYGFIVRNYQHPNSAQMPCVVQVGERKDFFLIYNRNCFLKEKRFVRIGIGDSFGRIHWASRKAYKKAQEDFKKETWEWLGDETS